MEIRELRIGNLLNHYELGMVEVIGVGKDYIHVIYNGETHYENVRSFSTIPLTEEILLKFGFKYREFLNDFFIKLDDHNILIAEKEVIWFAIYKCEENQRKYFLTKRYYAHQLQNLFFSLCGEELTFK